MTKSLETVKTPLFESIQPALTTVLESLAKSHGTTQDTFLKLQLAEAFVRIADIIMPGSKILPAPGELQNSVRVANRVVSFLLGGSIQYGTGILVGPSHVLTAAHLFFTSKRELIDPTRISQTTVAIDTTLLGDIVFKSKQELAVLEGSADDCFIEPVVRGGIAQREVDVLDFAIVKLDSTFGMDVIGAGETRDWFHLPTADDGPTLSDEMPVRAYQYVRDELNVSVGFLRTVSPDGIRVPHTASTVDGSSGAPLIADGGTLVAMHVSGPLSGGTSEASNYAIPITTIATQIDTLGADGTTARSRMNPRMT